MIHSSSKRFSRNCSPVPIAPAWHGNGRWPWWWSWNLRARSTKKQNGLRVFERNSHWILQCHDIFALRALLDLWTPTLLALAMPSSSLQTLRRDIKTHLAAVAHLNTFWMISDDAVTQTYQPVTMLAGQLEGKESPEWQTIWVRLQTLLLKEFHWLSTDHVQKNLLALSKRLAGPT